MMKIKNSGHKDGPAPLVTDAKAWARTLVCYRQRDSARSITEVAITAVPFFALWILMVMAIRSGLWVALLLALPAAGLLVRLFMIQHDCGHGSFFGRRWANDWIGRVLSVFTLTPYDLWRHSHAMHHAGSGNLERRGFGDVHTLTIDEYQARSGWGRFRYRAYRHPLVMFGVGPAYLFFLQHRIPFGHMRGGLMPWTSVMSTNLAIALVAALLIWLLGFTVFALVHLPIMLIAATVGVWLFFIQHQFENTSWEHEDDWNWHDAALLGSSNYELPAIIRWFSANIGVHHVHHLCSRIPFYRLQCVLRDHPELQGLGRITLRESFACVKLVLWDPSQCRLVSLKEAARRGNGSSSVADRASIDAGSFGLHRS
jgi:acyl-lipid omega-6 desaturase (Delta-12 desaturase)